MKRILLGAVVAIAFFVALPAAAASAEPVADEAQFLALLNQVRVSRGLNPVLPDAQLQSIARQWSERLRADGALSHNPNIAGQVSNWRLIGENVGVGATVQQLHDAFVASPKHYENIAEPKFDYVGIGVVEDAGQIWVTFDFKESKSAVATAPAVPKPAPKPAPAPRPAAAPRPAPKPAPAPRPAAAPQQVAAPKPAVAPPAPSTTAAPAPAAAAAAPEVAGESFERPAPASTTPTPAATNNGLEVVAGLLLVAVAVRALQARRA